MTKAEVDALKKQQQQIKHLRNEITLANKLTKQELKTQATVLDLYLQQRKQELEGEAKVSILGLQTERKISSTQKAAQKQLAKEVSSIQNTVASGLLTVKQKGAKAATEDARVAAAGAVADASAPSTGVSPVYLVGGAGVLVLALVLILKKRKKK